MGLPEGHVFLHGAGTWFYKDGAPLAEMRIRVDGNLLPNITAMYFGQPGARHPFSLVGAYDLAAGSHTIELVAMATLGSGNFMVLGSSQINVLVGFGAVRQSVTGDVDVPQGSTVSSAQMSPFTQGTVFLNHSGTIQRVDHSADATSFITVDGSTGPSSLGINDMVSLHDEIAPISAMAMSSLSSSYHNFGLVSAQLPGYPLSFKLLHGSALVVAYGGITTSNSIFDRVDQKVGLPVPFPPTNSVCPHPISFTLPAGHNGNVFISTNGRWYDEIATDAGGTVAAVLMLDGQQVGPIAVQRFEPQNTQSQRNFSLPYLAKGQSPGNHTVCVRVFKANTNETVTLSEFIVYPDTAILW